MNNGLPNIVWICADDFAANVCGAYGNSLAKTPHIDRLAAEGIKFNRAYCNSPLSTPSRQAFWTGKYPWSLGVTLSPTPLPEEEVTLPVMLKQRSYEIAAFGKTHNYAPRKKEFDYCADRAEYQEWLFNKGVKTIPTGIQTLGAWRPFWQPASQWLNSSCLPYGARDEDMQDTYHARQAETYLAKKHKFPFFLFVSFYSNHSPFRFPVEFAGRYHPDQFVVPKVTEEEKKLVPEIFLDLTEQEKKGIRAAYYTAVEYTDKNVGIVLNALNCSKFSDNTLVLFTNDHGYLLGEHGRFEKHCHYEEGVRCALLMRFPKMIRAGATSDALVELIDIVPTLLDFTQTNIPDNIHGRSFLPLLKENGKIHRDYVISHYAGNEEAMIRTPFWKLIYYRGERKRRDGYASRTSLPKKFIQLFDLIHDPKEYKNVAKEHPQIVEDLLKQLATSMYQTARHPEEIPPNADAHTIFDLLLPPLELKDRNKCQKIKKTIFMLLQNKFGHVPKKIENDLYRMISVENLEMLLNKTISAQTIEELQQFLDDSLPKTSD